MVRGEGREREREREEEGYVNRTCSARLLNRSTIVDLRALARLYFVFSIKKEKEKKKERKKEREKRERERERERERGEEKKSELSIDTTN